MSAVYADNAPTYFHLGWAPMPLPPGEKYPPPKRWTGHGAAYPSRADVEGFAEHNPDGNIALRLPPNVLGLDVDCYEEKPGAATLAQLEKLHGPLPTTYTSTSRTDGSGIRCFRVPPGRSWPTGPGPGIEFVHAGHRYMVTAPSRHPSGATYRWIGPDGQPSPAPQPTELPELPATWVAAFDRGEHSSVRHAPVDDMEVKRFLDAHTADERLELLEIRVARLVKAAGAGASRHDTTGAQVVGALEEAAAGFYPARLAADKLRAAFLASVAGEARPWPEHEFLEWLKWAVPKASTADLDAVRARVARNVPPLDQLLVLAGPTPTSAIADDLREGMHHGQLRMAYRLANSRYRDRLLHVHGVGWHHWDGSRWAFDDQAHAIRAVRAILRRALADSLELEKAAAKALRSDVNTCSSATGTRGVLSLAETMAPFAATVRDLDVDPYLLNCNNGTLDLRTLQLRDHQPGDRITKVTVAAYVPGVDAGPWDTFLYRVLPDPKVRSFLQRIAGVALLGRVVEHILPIATGTGANGKGVFTRALEHAFGDYADTAESELFMHREGAHPTGEMDLLGLRWVTVSETDHGRQLAEATMKRLTGGDPIKARKMRQDFVTFMPSHTALLVTNHLPAVRGDDPAIWRRIRVVPFDVVIPEAERDKHLDERLQLEAEAVLAWAVAGYSDYAARGELSEPEAVTQATSAYRNDSDPVAQFITDECLVTPHGYVGIGELYGRWQKWASQEDAAPMTQKAFGSALDRKGYPADRAAHGRRIRRGLLLTAEETPEGDG